MKAPNLDRIPSWIDLVILPLLVTYLGYLAAGLWADTPLLAGALAACGPLLLTVIGSSIHLGFRWRKADVIGSLPVEYDVQASEWLSQTSCDSAVCWLAHRVGWESCWRTNSSRMEVRLNDKYWSEMPERWRLHCLASAIADLETVRLRSHCFRLVALIILFATATLGATSLWLVVPAQVASFTVIYFFANRLTKGQVLAADRLTLQFTRDEETLLHWIENRNEHAIAVSTENRFDNARAAARSMNIQEPN